MRVSLRSLERRHGELSSRSCRGEPGLVFPVFRDFHLRTCEGGTSSRKTKLGGCSCRGLWDVWISRVTVAPLARNRDECPRNRNIAPSCLPLVGRRRRRSYYSRNKLVEQNFKEQDRSMLKSHDCHCSQDSLNRRIQIQRILGTMTVVTPEHRVHVNALHIQDCTLLLSNSTTMATWSCPTHVAGSLLYSTQTPPRHVSSSNQRSSTRPHFCARLGFFPPFSHPETLFLHPHTAFASPPHHTSTALFLHPHTASLFLHPHRGRVPATPHVHRPIPPPAYCVPIPPPTYCRRVPAAPHVQDARIRLGGHVSPARADTSRIRLGGHVPRAGGHVPHPLRRTHRRLPPGLPDVGPPPTVDVVREPGFTETRFTRWFPALARLPCSEDADSQLPCSVDADTPAKTGVFPLPETAAAVLLPP